MELPIPTEINKVLDELNSLFQERNHSLYLVGGPVRDLLLGQVPHDYDLVTDATPEETVKILSNRYHINEQGRAFGVIALYRHEEPREIEIASFQTRHAGRVVTGTTIEEDVLRRDLTINALYYHLSSRRVIDLVEGMNDLKTKKIKTVGNPIDRFNEDPLRIQRVLRFLTRFNSKIEPDLAEAIVRTRHLITEPSSERPNGVSSERIYHELLKAFDTCQKFKPYLDQLQQLDLWPFLFKQCLTRKVEQYLDTANFVVALAQIFIEEPSEHLVGKSSLAVSLWKFPRKTADQIALMHQLIYLEIENAVDLRLRQDQLGLEREVLEEWYRVKDLSQSKRHRAFLQFNYKEIKSADIIKESFIKIDKKGSPINKEEAIKLKDAIYLQRETLFKKLVDGD